jgi:1,4-dihydroxy-2-naphthoate octaprenyltransferase
MTQTEPKRPPLWIIKTRAPFFTEAFVPILLGSLIAWAREGAFYPGYFLLTMIGGICLQAGVNMTNDYFDHVWGSDEVNQEFVNPFTGGSRLIQMGVVPARTILLEGLAYFAVGGLIGLFLTVTRGPWVLWLGIFGALTGYFYTAPPFRLVATGVGELFIFTDFGLLMTLGAYYTQTTTLAWEPVIAALPVGFLIAAVLYINEFQDAKADAAVGKNQIVVRLGRKRAVRGYQLLMALTYGSLILGVLLDGVSPYALIGLLTLPIAWRGIQVARQHYDDPQRLVPANAATIQAHLLTGLLMSAGYVLQLLV